MLSHVTNPLRNRMTREVDGMFLVGSCVSHELELSVVF